MSRARLSPIFPGPNPSHEDVHKHQRHTCHRRARPPMIANTMHRQVLILASAQALFQIVSVMVMTVGGLAGAQLAGSPSWATLPIATMFLGTATVTFPAAMWMARVGRRTGFLFGTA